MGRSIYGFVWRYARIFVFKEGASVWEIISNISSICNILGLPLALWQIYSIKFKIESTERGIKNILDIKEHEELNRIFALLEKQHAELSDLITQLNKSGKSRKSSNEKCCLIMRGIKSHMKISGQFESETTADNHALIRTYIET